MIFITNVKYIYPNNHFKKKIYLDTNFSYQIKWLIEIIIKLGFGC